MRESLMDYKDVYVHTAVHAREHLFAWQLFELDITLLSKQLEFQPWAILLYAYVRDRLI